MTLMTETQKIAEKGDSSSVNNLEQNKDTAQLNTIRATLERYPWNKIMASGGMSLSAFMEIAENDVEIVLAVIAKMKKEWDTAYDEGMGRFLAEGYTHSLAIRFAQNCAEGYTTGYFAVTLQDYCCRLSIAKRLLEFRKSLEDVMDICALDLVDLKAMRISTMAE